MSSQVLLLPETLGNDPAQHLGPEPVGNAAFLRIDVAPGNSPAAPLSLTGCFLCETRFTNARFAHQHHGLRVL